MDTLTVCLKVKSKTCLSRTEFLIKSSTPNWQFFSKLQHWGHANPKLIQSEVHLMFGLRNSIGMLPYIFWQFSTTWFDAFFWLFFFVKACKQVSVCVCTWYVRRKLKNAEKECEAGDWRGKETRKRTGLIKSRTHNYCDC